jgi:hypothetical protein
VALCLCQLIKKDGIEGSFEVGVYFYLCAIRTHELAKKLLRLEKCSKELAKHSIRACETFIGAYETFNKSLRNIQDELPKH